MQLHQIKTKNKPDKKKRIGRGGKRGTYSGKGIKGQKSRSGARFEPVVRYLIKKYPKLRGYRQNSTLKNSKPVVILNLVILEKSFASGDNLTPQILFEKKLFRKIKGRLPQVKILANGEISKNLIIKDCIISKQAREKIEKAGGKIE